MHWKLYEGSSKWGFVIQKFSDRCNQYLNLTVGDFVFIVRHTAEWYYGFKSTDSSKFGAFPKVCVCIGKSEILSEVGAEMQMMFAELLLLYRNNAQNELSKVTPTISKIIELKESLSRKVTEHEMIEGLRGLLSWVSLGQRELTLPITLRDQSLKSICPYSKVPVDLVISHRKFLKHIVDPKSNAHLPATQLFSLRISFSRLPQAELTVFLASQPILRQNEHILIAPSVSVADGLMLEHHRNTEPNIASMSHSVTSAFQVAPKITRLTENVILNCYGQSSRDVIFTDLDPFQPREERLLLMVLVNRMGPVQVKRPKSNHKASSNRTGSTLIGSAAQYRRPVGVACVDITKQVVPCLHRPSWMDSTTHKQPPNGLFTNLNVSLPRVVTVVTTGEQFQMEALLNLAKQTPLSYFTGASGRDVMTPVAPAGLATLNALIDSPSTPPATQTAFTSSATTTAMASTNTTGSNTAIPDDLDFTIANMEVLSPQQSQILTCSSTGDQRVLCGRRFGFSKALSVEAESDRCDLFVTLLSGEFSKGTKKQEKNVEVEISVRDSSGNLLNWQPINRTTSSVFHSTVYYHKNHPRWSELFTVALPPGSTSVCAKRQSVVSDRRRSVLSQLEDSRAGSFADIRYANEPGELACAHLRFVCRHRSGGTSSKDKLLGVAFLRLQPSTAIPVLLLDGCYQLVIHKMDAHQIESCAYLRETSFLSNGPIMSAGSGSSMGSSGSQGSLGTSGLLSSSALASSFGQSKQRNEILSVETRLCSSFHTTDENLTKVLLWRKYQDDLVMCLPRGINLSQKYLELQKFTRALIDNLLQILCTTLDQNGTSPRLNLTLGYSVLTALAKCYHDLLIKPAYQELITAYLNSAQFSYTAVHNPYLRLLNSILQDVLDRTSAPTETETTATSSAVTPVGSSTDSTGNSSPSVQPTRKTSNSIGEVPTGPGRIDDKSVEMIFSTIGWAFRMIVRSRQLELDCLPPESVELTENGTFVRQMDEFFGQLILVTRLTNNSLSLKIVNAVSQIVKDVVVVYPRARLARSIVSLLERMIDFPELPNRKLLVETIESPLFECAESRGILMPIIQRRLTKFFADTLTKELVPNRTEDHLVMDLWCDAMLTFISRFVHVTKQSQQSKPATVPASDTEKLELYQSLVQTGFVRWTMQQLGRVFLFVHQQDARSSGMSNDRTARASHGSGIASVSPTMRFSGGSRSSSPTIMKGRRSLSGERKSFSGFVHRQAASAAHRLQDVQGCLASVLFTLLDQFDLPLWRTLLTPLKPESTTSTDTPPPCWCMICEGLNFVPVFDFVHELVSLFSMMHTYPVYPAPTRHSTATTHTTESSATTTTSDTPHARSDPRRPIEFGGSWVEMLMAASTVELRVFRILIDVALTPLCVVKGVENKGSTELHRTVSISSSSEPGRFSAEHTFVTELINLVQHSLGSFVVQQCHLCLEALPAVLRTRVDRSLFGQAADMREVACELLVRLWNAMNERSKAYYIPMILPTVIDMTTVPLTKIRENCVNLIFDALRVNPSRVERVFVSEIDRVMQWAGTGFAANMHRLLGERLHTSGASSLDARRKGLITDLLRQIECLLNYGEFLNHSSKLSEMLALHNLRTLYESIGRKDMTLHYLYRLEGLHAECGNVIERGYTLEVISKQYTWSEEPVETSNIAPQYARYGAISSRALRERLLLDSLDCLKEATDFERAIEVCEQLAELYRTVSPNFPRLSQILREQAELYERIVNPTESRLSFRYYLLTLHGPGFARFLTERTNCLIYRTQAQLIELVNQLHEQFPQCTVLNKPPTEPGELFDGPCIFPSGNVKPVPVIPAHLSARGIDAKIKSYYLHNRVECFTYLRPLKQNTGEKRDKPQFEQIRHYVAEMMPGTMPIMPVIRTETKLLSPTELANDQVGEMIRHLETCLVKVTGPNGTMYMNDFVGILGSSIVSPVSGGLPKLLESVELSDDVGQESSFATLSESVLELLELQLAGLEAWYHLDPSPSPGVQLGDPNATGNFHLQSIVESYETLVRDMSCKFGFAVDHLKASHLRYGPVTSGTAAAAVSLGVTSSLVTALAIERRLSSGTTTLRAPSNSVQPSNSRALTRFDSVISGELTGTIRSDRLRFTSRPSIDTNDIPLFASSVFPDASIASLLASEPPPLPDRPLLRKASLSECHNLAIDRVRPCQPNGEALDASSSTVSSSNPSLSSSTCDRRTTRTTRPEPSNHRENAMHMRPPIPNRHCAVADRVGHIPPAVTDNSVSDDIGVPPIPERQRGSSGGASGTLR